MTEDRVDEERVVRIGDAERDDAARELGDHYAVGRLTAGEFDDRLGRVYATRTDAELGALLGDLPRPVTASTPARRRRHRLPARALTAAALVVAGIGTGFGIGRAVGGSDGPPGPPGHVWRVPGGHPQGPWVHPGEHRP
jgi:hypothetical protein